MRAPSAWTALLASLTLLLAGAGPAAAAPTASDEVGQCTEDGLLCIEGTAIATITCDPVQDGAVSCLATATWIGAGGSPLPVSLPARVERGAEAIVTVCEVDLCMTAFILFPTSSCIARAVQHWCTMTFTMEEPMVVTLQPGECADFMLTTLLGVRMFYEPRTLHTLLTESAAPLLDVLTGPRVEHRVCA